MYKAEFAKSFQKDIKKLSHEVQIKIVDEIIPMIIQKPEIGDFFVGSKLKGFQKYAFRFKKNDYRIVYKINKTQIIIVFLAIGSRENFYKRLDRLF